VLAVSPSLAGLPLGRLAARGRRVPWAAVVQDLMGNAAANGGVRGGGRVASLVTDVERRMLRSADLVGVIGEGFADAVQRMGVPGDRVRLLPNWAHVTPSTATRAEARAALGWRQDVFSVVHTGNMGAKQGLDNVVHAAAEADRRGADVELVLVGDGNQRSALQQAGAGVRSLRFVDPVDAETYPLVLAAADVLLVNERADMLEMSLPSKLTSYFAAGRPVLGAVPERGWTAAVLDASGAAVRVGPDSPGELLDAALELAADEERVSLLGKAATEYCHARYGSAAGLGRYADLVRELLVR
jgi:glycosyltransferase involved in cell wall biosynthesis